MSPGRPGSTRDRVVTEAMRLFGEQGYAATTISQIEAASGLSPGSGGLYKHFRSKAEILAEGIGRLIEAGASLRALLDPPAEATPPDRFPVRDRVAFVARAGLRRLEQERDFNRILVRDLQTFPDLLERARDDEIRHTHQQLARWLAGQADQGDQGDQGDQAETTSATHDWEAVAAVVMDATAHYWLLRDIFGGDHPTTVSEQRYLGAMVDMVAGLLERPAPAETD